MSKNLFVILTISIIAYLGLSFMDGSGGSANDLDSLEQSATDTIVSLPPADLYKSDLKLTKAPYLRCKAAIVVDNNTDQILYEINADEKRPIASITKLLAAIVLVEMEFDLNKKIIISSWDARNSAKSHLKVGEKFTARDLFYAAMICSDNRAIKALSRSTDISYPEFVKKMNEKARMLGMDSTSVVEPSGIFDDNISTAKDCAKLINAALNYPMIKSALTCQRYEFRSLNHKRLHRIPNTNRLLKSKWYVDGGKTGYISASGYCLANRMRDDAENDITTVVLGCSSNSKRFIETRKAAEWAFKNLNNHLADGGK